VPRPFRPSGSGKERAGGEGLGRPARADMLSVPCPGAFHQAGSADDRTPREFTRIELSPPCHDGHSNDAGESLHQLPSGNFQLPGSDVTNNAHNVCREGEPAQHSFRALHRLPHTKGIPPPARSPRIGPRRAGNVTEARYFVLYDAGIVRRAPQEEGPPLPGEMFTCTSVPLRLSLNATFSLTALSDVRNVERWRPAAGWDR